jgi:hypothetical protein
LQTVDDYELRDAENLSDDSDLQAQIEMGDKLKEADVDA